MGKKKYKITVVAKRESDILGMLEENRQDHMVQLLQMDFDFLQITIEEIKDGIESTNTSKT